MQGEMGMPTEKVIPILDQVCEFLQSAAAHLRKEGVNPLYTEVLTG